MAKLGARAVNVKGYTLHRKGKLIHVKGHSRKKPK